MGPPPGAAQGADRKAGWVGTVGNNVWASLGALAGLWLVLGFVLFIVFAFATQSVTVALLAGTVAGLAAAGVVGHRMGWLQRVDQARRDAPLWVRLLLPLPLFALLWLLLIVGLGPVLPDFVLLMLADTVLSLVLTGTAVWFLGLWDDVPRRVRQATPNARLATLAGIGLAGGLLASLVGLVVLGEVNIALALFLPVAALAAVGTGWATGWRHDAREAMRALHLGARLGLFVLALVVVTYYIALLVGPFLPNATASYGASLALALLLLVPLSMWARTWGDLWTLFTSMGEDHRVLAVLPVFPLAAALVFLAVVVFTSDFRIAYVVSIPAGLALMLAVGWPFKVTQDIPKVVRSQDLPARSGVFAATYLVLTLYLYFAVALFLQQVEASLLIALGLAGVMVAGLVRLLDLHQGLREEFDAYGAPAEAAVLGVLFVGSLALAFLLIALALGDFRLAFLSSVIVAAGVSYAVAHSTGMVEGMRAALSRLPWWGDLLVLGAVFLLAFAYATLALGVFYSRVTVAFAFGAFIGLAAVAAVGKDLQVGDELLQTADGQRSARTTLLVLTFLGGFLVGLYVTAAALRAVGNDLFGLPFFVALITGTGALIAVSRSRGWDRGILGRARTVKDQVKVLAVVGLWLAIGTFTGFALQSVPVSASTLGLGDDPYLPLTLTLAVGLLLWTWLPVVLSRVIRVEKPPLEATLTMSEKPKFWVSLLWGLVAFGVVLVVVLSVIDEPVIGFSVAIAAGYLVALAMTTLRGGKGSRVEEDEEPVPWKDRA